MSTDTEGVAAARGQMCEGPRRDGGDARLWLLDIAAGLIR